MSPQPEPDNALRLYVIVNRPILPLVHAGVQAGHAASEYVWWHKELPSTKQWAEDDRTLIYLEGTIDDMGRVMNQYAEKHMKYQPFYEPDMKDTLTAVAFQPVSKNEAAEYFAGLKLLK